jgi:hypothetical protein
MFQPSQIVAVPGHDWGDEISGIVHVPVLGLARTTMPQHPRRYTARTEGTSDIEVIAGLHVKVSLFRRVGVQPITLNATGSFSGRGL